MLTRGARRADPGDWPRADLGDLVSGGRSRPRHDGSASAEMASDRWAQSAYDDIRRTDRDIDSIADNLGDSGLGRQEIADIKDHLFTREHELDGPGSPPRPFDADADQAEAWMRLRAGRHLPQDVVLLRHELAELRQMREHGSSYRDAHTQAQRDFPWSDDVPQNDLREDIDGDW